MKAIVYQGYGSPDVLKTMEMPIPTPKDDEVLVKVQAASVNAADLHYMRGKPFLLRLSSGLLKPKNKILGSDFAGRVETIGKDVHQFRVGDDVFGSKLGGFAEYVAVPENKLALKPVNISFEEAAAVPLAAATALQGLRDKGHIQPGQKVLVNGASGGVGTFAVQIAKSFGAEVTGVCSTRNMDTVQKIGADHVIDYTKEDFTKNNQRYDLILAANGYHSILDYRHALSSKGRYVMSGGSMTQFAQALLLGPLLSIAASKKMGSMLGRTNQEDLGFMKQLLETGKVVPVIDKRYTLDEVPEAIRYLEEGHAQGKIVIRV